MTRSRLRSRPRGVVVGGVALALVAVLSLAVGLAIRGRAWGPLSTRVDPAPVRHHGFEGRLSVQARWRPCVVDTFALVARASCEEEAPSPSVQTVDRHASAKSLHALALVDLRWQTDATARLDRAIDALEAAARAAPRDAAVLNDLAVVYLARAERDQHLLPLLQALEAIERARVHAHDAPAVRFNRALILERLSLVRTARDAWRELLAVEGDVDWRRDATSHLARLSRGADARLLTAGVDSLLVRHSESRVRQMTGEIRRSPQAAREAAFALLAEWATSRRSGDLRRAERSLDVAREIAASLAALPGDRSAALAIAAIDARQMAPTALDTLASAHADFAAGYALYAQAAYDDAFATLARAERTLRTVGSPFARWAALYGAAAAVNRGDYATTDQMVHSALVRTTPAEPLLRGKLLSTLGVSQVRRGGYEAAIRYYRDAMPHIAQSNESENVGATSSLLTEALELTGQSTAGQDEALRSLRLLAAQRPSIFLGNHLGLVATHARSATLHHAALAVLSEVLAVALPLDRPQLAAWTYAERAREQFTMAQADSATASLAMSLQWANRIARGRGRDQIRADATIAYGEGQRLSNPRAARDAMLRAVDTYRAADSRIKLPNALYQTALAARQAGDVVTARRCLVEAFREIETRRSWLPTAEMRASFYETAESVVDAIVTLELETARPAAAFAYLERARLAAWGVASRGVRRAPTLATLSSMVPRGTVLVEYALLPDRVVIWTITRGGTRHHVVPIARDSVAMWVTRFQEQAGAPDLGRGSARAMLFDVLLRPLARDLASATRLVVVPDRELSRIPFAALWDAATGRYVVEDHVVLTMPSAEYLLATDRRGRSASAHGSVLVVGDPAVDSLALPPQIGRLPGAAREAAAVAQLYPDRRLLTGAAARRDSVLALLPARSLFHFAGHAVVNGDQPEFSYLALAAGRTASDGVLRAREIGRLRLSRMSLVILSACSSLGPRSTHIGPLMSLAYSFLRAGVPATVSSLWDVDDDRTTALLVAFHRRLTAGMPAAAALQAAQLDALRSGDARQRAPRVWAAFVYTGP